ncbi:MAG TPA: hypothetical protein VFO10_04910 [Oligoflexus sp.]|uniref:hypothetical protein n=1 Tax=Oligoflexus sp. TaxID=1971216 RepID=UPI002D80BB88|nr:hypothetical protein [Oligoflexus sp.]HET9236564.1 hypothetical protein [Oligoflexus sp.]
MRIASYVAALFVCIAGLSVANPAAAKAKRVCMKDGAEVKVKGKKPKEKEKDCTAQGGVWEKAKAAHEEKQESGMGGAW